MAKYRRKIDVIEAIQWTGNNKDDIFELCGDYAHMYNNCLFIDSMLCNRGDYILISEDGKVTISKPHRFEALYEKIE